MFTRSPLAATDAGNERVADEGGSRVRDVEHAKEGLEHGGVKFGARDVLETATRTLNLGGQREGEGGDVVLEGHRCSLRDVRCVGRLEWCGQLCVSLERKWVQIVLGTG
jgi:hypothetical protein